jgi:hypothetical protein
VGVNRVSNGWSTVVVAASGASAADVAPLINRQSGARLIAVNLTFRLFPQADILYAADSGFWQWYADARAFPGVKIAPDERAKLYCKNLEIYDIPRDVSARRHDRLIFEPGRRIGCGCGNSGFQALNIAVLLGARRIALAGFDYCGKHWHADHPPTLRNPSEAQLSKWRAALDAEADELAAHGVDVVNMSSRSALRNYRYESPEMFFDGSRSAGIQA